ncbi:hypothetical protein [Coralloluteibacterium thermophilus]|uniref:Omptin family outer membrane protease n=1 Tax=Coralloluteibacterium thermophilum TaxID=2707049 RepID=A0ABV9NPK3_9GAMM
MKTPHALALALFGASAVAAPASGQNWDDRFTLRLSAFNPTADLRLSADGVATDGTETATFDDGATLEFGREWRPRGEIEFRMTERQRLVGNYYDYRRSQSRTWGGGFLDPGDYFDPGEPGVPDEPVEVPEVDVDGRLNFSLASLNYEYSPVETETLRWGIGLGLAYAELEANATATSTPTEDLDPESVSYRWKRTGLSPGVFTRLTWAPAERWRFSIEGQYFDTRWGDFLDERGHFERGGLIAEYLVSERMGIHVGYDWFRLKLSDDYRGTVPASEEAGTGEIAYDGTITGQLKVHGPMAGVTFRF